ncbi:MAG TPA: hypothetical protein VN238_12380, partial [Solirubrobacteraceae bacterium]|nr:hypothetical protein [Solirubrobacteraceae bacterium]
MDDLDALYRRLGDELAGQLDELVAELTDLYRRELPGYDAVPRSSIEENVRALLQVLVGRLREGRGFEATEAEMGRIARGYLDAAVPLSAISRSFQLGVLHLIARLREGLRATGADESAVDAMQDAVWRWTLTAAAAIAAAERDQAVAAARRDAGRRAELLRDLAAGAVTPQRLREE